MITSREDLLMNLLHCGSLDLAVLDNVGYDFCDILELLDDIPIQQIGFNGLMRAVIDFGIICIGEAIEARIAELQGYQDREDLSDSEKEELQALEKLSPDEDIGSYHNFLDTHVYFEHHASIYRRYLEEALDAFREGTGFEIGGDDE